MKRVLDFNPMTGETITFEFHESEDKFTIRHEQDVEPIIESNKNAALDVDFHKKQAQADWAHYAKIPNVVIMKWMQDYGVDFNNRNHWPKVMKLLNDPEWKYLKRTSYTHDR